MGFLRKKSDASYTLFFATDLHGSEKCFRKFLRAAEFYKANALVLGGDLTGKLLVPIVRLQDGTLTANFLDNQVVVRDGAELDELKKSIRFNGHYVYECDANEVSRMGHDDTYQHERFSAVIRSDLEAWMRRADEVLSSGEIPCIGIPGNDDEEYVGDVLSRSQRVVNGEGRVVEMGPYQVLSYGYSNHTPWNSPRELSEEELGAALEKTAQDLEPGRPTIFNVHVPPYDSGLDLAPELSNDLSLRGGATSSMKPVGSTAVAEAIAKHSPVLTLHGHVHESRASARLGGSLALNPGSEYNAGVLRGVLVRLDGDRVTSHQFVGA